MKSSHDEKLFNAIDHIPALGKARAKLTAIRQELTAAVDLLDTEFDSHLQIMGTIAGADEAIAQAETALHQAGVKLAESHLLAFHPETLPAVPAAEDETGD